MLDNWRTVHAVHTETHEIIAWRKFAGRIVLRDESQVACLRGMPLGGNFVAAEQQQDEREPVGSDRFRCREDFPDDFRNLIEPDAALQKAATATSSAALSATVFAPPASAAS